MSLATAYHEAGHAIVALQLGRPIDAVSAIGGAGRLTLDSAFSDDPSPAELEDALTIAAAGELAAEYSEAAPLPSPEEYSSVSSTQDDAWPYSVDELCALDHVGWGAAPAMSDDQKAAHWTDGAGGPEVRERARKKAIDLIAVAAADGTLDLLAGHLSRRCFLTAGDVARILQNGREPQ